MDTLEALRRINNKLTTGKRQAEHMADALRAETGQLRTCLDEAGSRLHDAHDAISSLDEGALGWGWCGHPDPVRYPLRDELLDAIGAACDRVRTLLAPETRDESEDRK